VLPVNLPHLTLNFSMLAADFTLLPVNFMHPAPDLAHLPFNFFIPAQDFSMLAAGIAHLQVNFPPLTVEF
jgi:hypothetical protein